MLHSQVIKKKHKKKHSLEKESVKALGAKITSKSVWSKAGLSAVAAGLKKVQKAKAAAAAASGGNTGEDAEKLHKFIGQRVVVTEEAAGKEKFGKFGDVKQVVKDKDELLLKILGPVGAFSVKPEHVERQEKIVKVNQKNLKEVTRSLRQQWLAEGGRHVAEEKDLEQDFPALAAEVCSEHLQLWVRYLQWSYKTTAVSVLEPELLLMIFELQCSPEEDVTVFIHTARQKLKQAEIFLVPICKSDH